MIGKALAWVYRRFSGWQFEGEVPDAKKYVLIAAPHTSNWDLVNLLSLATQVKTKVHWMGKLAIFRRPFGGLMRRAGGVPIDRGAPQGVVQQAIDWLDTSDELILTVPPEGTRSRSPCWKSGFYHIALGAKVPVVMGYLDYSRKRGGFGPTVWLTGDARADMARFREFYKAKMARYPDLFRVPKLRSEITIETEAAPAPAQLAAG